MIHDLPKPDISPYFTVDDIHKIREWNYERFKDATIEEQRTFYSKESEWFAQRMAEPQPEPQ
jgi:hypothetical protein